MTTAKQLSIPDRLGGASLVFGLISLLVCWWFPYGAVLGACGTGLGVAGWVLGGRTTGVGTLFALIGTGSALFLAWDYWWRIFGHPG